LKSNMTGYRAAIISRIGTLVMLHCDLSPLNTRPRLCAVSYLNTLPLVWGILHGEQQGLFDVNFSIPAECADRLGNGSADIGVVPCAELERLNLDVIPGAGIACRGPVRSILLVSEVPPGQIRTLATDASSRSSVMLARILLAQRYGVEPQFIAMPPDLPSMLEKADAALIIGDPALHLDPATMPFHVLDLGAEWFEMTGLPMVFAVWAGRKGVVPKWAEAAFRASLQFGMTHTDDIVAAGARERGIPEALAKKYLTDHIVFELGEREYEGMNRFLQLAREAGSLNIVGRVPA
jgi:chorismate dehydratase